MLWWLTLLILPIAAIAYLARVLYVHVWVPLTRGAFEHEDHDE